MQGMVQNEVQVVQCECGAGLGGRPFGMQSENAPAIPAPTPPNGGQHPKTKGGGGMPAMPAVPSGPQSCPVVPSENARQRIRFFGGVFPLKAGAPARRRGPFVATHLCLLGLLAFQQRPRPMATMFLPDEPT